MIFRTCLLLASLAAGDLGAKTASHTLKNVPMETLGACQS